MPIYRVFIEETATRLLWNDVEAADMQGAIDSAHASLETDAWTAWQESDTDCRLEVRDEITEAR